MRIAVVLFALIAAGCGASRAAVGVAPGAPIGAPPSPSLAAFIEKTREVSARASGRPSQSFGATLESTDPDIGAAITVLALDPTPEAHRRAAAAYNRRGVWDKAHEHLTAALALDAEDGETYDALARLWRDARLPHLALSDAYRAVFHAPLWAAARNTLGTVFQALGRKAQARGEYERALALDPGAAYALNNLCYGWLLERRVDEARAACLKALAIDPALKAAHNNLGIVEAMTGDMPASRERFAAATDAAGALYNVGIMRLARREYGSAVEAFEAAQAARPSFSLAATRERQAREQLLRESAE
jgi:tetratricopeptide (TPR) repeat protein